MLPSSDARPLDPAVETWALEVPARLDMEATRELRQQLQTQLPGKHVVVVTDGARFRALESLDAAWAEATAALPEGTWLIEFGRRDSIHPTPNPHTSYPVSFPAHYFASAAREFTEDDGITEYGDTPAAALHALTAKLREARP